MDEETAKTLRRPFEPDQVGKLPRITCKKCSNAQGRVCDEHTKSECAVCGNWITTRHMHIDYVGHGAVTDRLLEADPGWVWEPVAWDANGMPQMVYDPDDNPVGLWMRLTVGDVTRLGYGSCPSDQADPEKVLIGDALRNAAMRFGVAVDLWIKGHAEDDERSSTSGDAHGRGQRAAQADQPADQAKLWELQLRMASLPETYDLDGAWAEAGLPAVAEITTAALLNKAFLLVNALGARARKDGVDLDVRRDAVLGDLGEGVTGLLAGPHTGTRIPPQRPSAPETSREGAGSGDTPADSPGATEGPVESPEDRAARKAAERDWKRRTAELVATLTGAAESLPAGTLTEIAEAVNALHHTKVNAELEAAGLGDVLDAPIEHRRWSLVGVRLKALRSASALEPRAGEEPF
jgi:hypothetical protein